MKQIEKHNGTPISLRTFAKVGSASLAIALIFAACGSTASNSATDAETEIETETETETGESVDDGSTTEDTGANTAEEAPEGDDSGATDETAAELVTGEGADISMFMDGALAEDITTVDCTLSGGTETTCHQITIAGTPADVEVGPFCPSTTSDSAEDGGIWFDGENIYDVDGEFIRNLAEIYSDDFWLLYDEDGNINVTDTQEAFEAAARPDVAEEYINHCVAGKMEWLDNGEPVKTTVEVPISPVIGDSTSNGGQILGVTFSGVPIQGPAPVSDILGAHTIAAFDDCGAHINPTDGYHMHGANGCSEVGTASDGETSPFAIALDGFAIHSALDEADLANANLDECNGHATDELEYHYHAEQTETNGVLTCFVGETVGGSGEERGGGRGPRNG